jgi:hypothetical protein
MLCDLCSCFSQEMEWNTGRQQLHQLPPHSSDLTKIEFFLWKSVKEVFLLPLLTNENGLQTTLKSSSRDMLRGEWSKKERKRKREGLYVVLRSAATLKYIF